MKIGVPKETAEHEFRVALVPEGVRKIVASGFEVLVESGAGESAHFADEAYREAGATVVENKVNVLNSAAIVVKVQPPDLDDIEVLQKGAVLISFMQSVRDRQIVEALTARRITALSMNLVPRITRAQAMDALSSQSNIAGYKAVLLGAVSLQQIMPMMITAAGTIRPSSVLVLGAGVAGLQAIATARRLGAVVSAFDVRPAVKEQVESLGAKFLEIDLVEEEAESAGGYAKQLSEEDHLKEQNLLLKAVKNVDIVISTALIPDKPAPLLITGEMVSSMKPGSVIVDLAAEAGGNCELTEPGEVIVKHDVTIIGELNLSATVAINASQMYSRNVAMLLEEIIGEGGLEIDLENDVVGPSTSTHEGEIRI